MIKIQRTVPFVLLVPSEAMKKSKRETIAREIVQLDQQRHVYLCSAVDRHGLKPDSPIRENIEQLESAIAEKRQELGL